VFGDADAGGIPIADLPAGFELTVVGRRGPWVHVISGDGLDGWVSGAALAGVAVGVAPVAAPGSAPDPAAASNSAAPAPVAVVEKQSSSLLLAAGPVFGAIGGMIAILGTALPWQQTTATRLEINAFDVSVRFLASWDDLTAGGISIGLLVVILAGIGTVVSMIGGGGIVRRILGFVIVVICAVYVLQQQDWLITNERGLGTGLNVWDIADYGVLVSFFGGLVMTFAPSR